jgi:predicted nucleotidyltransferase
MPRLSSSSSGARFLDKDRVVRELQALALLARQAESEIQSVVLFGSIAKNNYTPRSDADLLIVLKHSPERFLRLFLDASVPVEVFPYTVQECKTVPLARRALREGQLL